VALQSGQVALQNGHNKVGKWPYKVGKWPCLSGGEYDSFAAKQSHLIFCSGGTEKATQAVKTTPHINLGKGGTLVPSTVSLLHHRGKQKNDWGSGGLQVGL